MIKRVVGIYFSPVGGTARMTRLLTQELTEQLNSCNPDGVTSEIWDLIRMDDPGSVLDEETVAVIGMPVYVGKMPVPGIRAMDRIRSDGAVTAIAVSYGGRTYGNALYELQHVAERQGFKVVGAGAFSVRYDKRRHMSASDHTVGSTLDTAALTAFANALSAKVRRLAGCEIEGLRIKPAPVEVAGRLPVHRVSRISPRAAAMAQSLLEKINIRAKDSEWYL